MMTEADKLQWFQLSSSGSVQSLSGSGGEIRSRKAQVHFSVFLRLLLISR